MTSAQWRPRPVSHTVSLFLLTEHTEITLILSAKKKKNVADDILWGFFLLYFSE